VNTAIHTASHDVIVARTAGTSGSGVGITGFLVPVGTPGFKVEEYLWTFNMPTDHGRVSLRDVRVPDRAVFGRERITEGTEEIQMRRVAGYLFGFIQPDTLKGVTG
jgi:hypothetical protein